MLNITFDPSRLLALARRRDDARALVSAGNDRYQDLRLQAQDLRLRASLVVTRNDNPNARDDAAAEGARLSAEADAISAQMARVEAETNEKARTANGAARLLKSAIGFAVETGLTIPAELAVEARGDAGAHQLSITGGSK